MLLLLLAADEAGGWRGLPVAVCCGEAGVTFAADVVVVAPRRQQGRFDAADAVDDYVQWKC